MARLLISDDASNSIEVIANWLSVNASSKAKVEFLSAVTGKMKLLESSPELGRLSEMLPGLRGLILDRHHKMYYTYSAGTVTVLAVVDMRRQPGGTR